jgi:hypothetical protein
MRLSSAGHRQLFGLWTLARSAVLPKLVQHHGIPPCRRASRPPDRSSPSRGHVRRPRTQTSGLRDSLALETVGFYWWARFHDPNPSGSEHRFDHHVADSEDREDDGQL